MLPSQMVNRTDEELNNLFGRAREGDQTALTEAMEALDPFLEAICGPFWRRSKCSIGPEDLLQEARLAALELITQYSPREGVPPTYFVRLCVRRWLRKRLEQAERRDGRALSLEAPMMVSGRDERTLQEISQTSLVCHQPGTDWELEELLDRVPKGGGVGGDKLRLQLQAHNLQKALPDDQTLVALVKEGKTLDELAGMFEVSRLTVAKRLKAIRKSGVYVRAAKKDRPHSDMGNVPWSEKLAMIEAYLRDNPGATHAAIKRDLRIGIRVYYRAKQELEGRADGRAQRTG